MHVYVLLHKLNERVNNCLNEVDGKPCGFHLEMCAHFAIAQNRRSKFQSHRDLH